MEGKREHRGREEMAEQRNKGSGEWTEGGSG